MKKRIFGWTLGWVLALGGAVSLWGQSSAFKTGKSLDLQVAILRALQQEYVEELPMDSLVMKGVNAMLASLDPYTIFLPEEEEENIEKMTTGNYGGVGAIIRKVPEGGVMIVEPYAGSPAIQVGLEPGDILLELDGVSTLDLSVSDCSSRMRGQPGTSLEMLVKKTRTGDTVKVKLVREIVHISGLVYAGILRDSIAYIQLSEFTRGGAQEVRAALETMQASHDLKRVVLDLRGNGGGLLVEAVDLVSLFVPQGTHVLYTQGRTPESRRDSYTEMEPWNTEIPLMVLINSSSASSSEIVAGALQDLDRAVIAGNRSYGKGLVQSIRGVGYDASLKLTVGKYYTPSGRCVQAIDYSARGKDGSLQKTPDSLRQSFKTRAGRLVYDGGGITPDLEVKPEYYTRPLLALVYSGILEDYAIRYYREHPSVPSPADLYLSDEAYEDFVQYASEQTFDHRTEAAVEMDRLIEVAKEEGTYEAHAASFEALKQVLDQDKRTYLMDNKAIIKSLLEREVAVVYYFQAGGAERGIADDRQLFEAIDRWGEVCLMPAVTLP